VFRGLPGWLKGRVVDDPVADRAERAGGAQLAEVAVPQADQAGCADRQRDGAEPEQRRRGTVPLGSLGIWVNAEMSIIQVGRPPPAGHIPAGRPPGEGG
jgi:hypothetical protein